MAKALKIASILWYDTPTGGTALNPTTFITSGTYYASQMVNGCESATRAATTVSITPSTTNTTLISACGTYTWANNGQTYTASGIYSGTTENCVTEILDLTITPSAVNTGALTITNATNSGGTARNIHQSTSAPGGSDGAVGDLWVLYS